MRKYFLLFFLLFCAVLAWSQNVSIDSVKREYDQLYGLDIDLYSGKKNMVYYVNHYGHPFWKSQNAFRGDLVLEGKKYNGQLLNYNIEKQEFILTYLDFNGGKNQIILIPERIDSVFIDDVVFIPSSQKAIQTPFVQLIYSNQIQCYKTWRKELEIAKKVKSVSGFAYTKEQTGMFLLRDDRVHKFYNKKSYLRFFDKEYWNDIKKYISGNHLKMREISDEELKDLVKYCEGLER